MPAQIRPNRLEVNDRFPMLGFTIRTDGKPGQVELAIGTDPGLFRAEGKPARSSSNFYSTRARGPLAVARDEAVYIVPPEILARFVGQERLYFGIATLNGGNGREVSAITVPSEGSPYVSLRGFTGRSLRRIRLLPSRQRAQAGYGDHGAELEWAGDAPSPGMRPLTGVPGGNGATAQTGPQATPLPVPNGGGNGADTAQAGALGYDDGYGDMPESVPAEAEPEDRGIEGPIPDAPAAAEGMTARAFQAPPDYDRASRFVPAHSFRRMANPRTINRIVIHITDGGSNIAGPISWFQNPDSRVSAHYIVAQDGEIVQMVRENDVAWHASSANGDSIGIEHVARKPGTFGRNDAGLMPTDAQYVASAALTRHLCAKYGLPSDRMHVLGHAEADTRTTHTACPNSVWDWDRYMALLAPVMAGHEAEPLAYARAVRAAALDHGEGGEMRGSAPAEAEDRGIEGPIPDAPAAAEGMAARARAFEATPEYDQASRFVPAHSFRRMTRPRTINRIVIHITDGRSKIAGPISWFQNPKSGVSAHYIVGQDGEIVQMVHENDIAWHANNANGDSIGIEHVARTPGEFGKEDPGMMPTDAQYAASAALTRHLCGKYGLPIDREHVLGHAEADTRTTHSRCPNSVWDWDRYMALLTAATAGQEAEPMAYARAAGSRLVAARGQTFQSIAPARAMSVESISLNWDDVPLVAQPTDVSCWATAAAMVLSWAGQESLTPEFIAQVAGRTTGQPLDATQVAQFAQAIGLVAEAPRSYTIEAFRSLLQQNGPLWVGAITPLGQHAVVVTGLFGDGAGDGTNTFVRVADPWDRLVDTPGAPGAYLDTHRTGSRYILSWPEFVREYEQVAKEAPSAGIQVLHAGGTGGRVPNSGKPAGYAMALGIIPGPRARPFAQVQPIYQPSNPTAAAQLILEWQARLQSWRAGVPDTSFFPHSAICSLEIELGGKRARGTGFYIGPDRILTCAHCVMTRHGEADRITVMAGRNGASNWLARFTVERGSWVVHPSYDGSGAFDLALLFVDTPPPTGMWFDLLEELNVSQPSPIVVCGYAAESVDPDKQHLDGDAIRALGPTDETISYNLQTEGGASGSPVFYVGAHEDDERQMSVMTWHLVGVHRSSESSVLNQACRLTEAKIAWIRSDGRTSTGQALGRSPRPLELAPTLPASHAATGSDGSVSWELEQYPNFKLPDGVALPVTPEMILNAGQIRLDDWPYLAKEGGGQVAAVITVDWQYTGQSVGNVRLAYAGKSEAPGLSLQVVGRCLDAAMAPPVGGATVPAALTVQLEYAFGREGADAALAVTELRLFGDGTYERESRWQRG